MLFATATCGGAMVGCDDNGAGGGQARIEMLHAAAGTYYFLLDSPVAGAVGRYTVHVTITDPPPANDTCAGATTLSLTEMAQTVTGSTLLATNADESGCGGGSGGRDVWYRFVLPAARTVYFDVLDTIGWNSTMRIVRGTCSSPTEEMCNDDACGTIRSRVTGQLTPGTYYLVVDGRTASDAGDFVLRFQEAACLPTMFVAGDASLCGSTASQPNVVSGDCAPGTPAP